jgi:hypothetical protein
MAVKGCPRNAIDGPARRLILGDQQDSKDEACLARRRRLRRASNAYIVSRLLARRKGCNDVHAAQ